MREPSMNFSSSSSLTRQVWPLSFTPFRSPSRSQRATVRSDTPHRFAHSLVFSQRFFVIVISYQILLCCLGGCFAPVLAPFNIRDNRHGDLAAEGTVEG